MNNIELATKHGAKFVQLGDKHQALAWRRGREKPLVILEAPTQEEAAQMYLKYFHVKER